MSEPSHGPIRDMEINEVTHAVIPSPNFDERALPITMLVLHYTEMQPMEQALGKLINPDSSVSAHYLISEQGVVTQLVPEAKRAWHAGKSYWRGIKDVNSASIGIELDHPGHSGGYRPFSDAQFDALVPLVARIVKDHDIPRANVVGHSDVAPMRKIDPGELFPWEDLAEYGLCLPRPTSFEKGVPFHNEGAFLLALERYGYDITEGRKTIEAFERRWRPEKISGVYDAQLGAILWHLLLERDQGRAR